MFSSNTSQVSGDTSLYVEDVFSTWLYTGTGANQTITNGIDLAGKGGLVTIKSRNSNDSMRWMDTNRGTLKFLESSNTNAEASAQTVTSYNSNGFSLGTSTGTNNSGTTYASWTFREQPKFFDVVTFTTVSGAMTIPHNLGATPGCWIIKSTSAGSTAPDWFVFHRSIPNQLLRLNGTGSVESGFSTATSTNITISNGVYAAGETLVIYLFAHNAGGFGLTGTDNVISCGSFTVNSGGNITAPVNLGYEPQFVMVKASSTASNWLIYDTMRGLPVSNSARTLYANSGSAEVGNAGGLSLSATGFGGFSLPTSSTCIYIAIRRGPMRVPTTGTSVFAPTASGAAEGTAITINFSPDAQIFTPRSTTSSQKVVSRLTQVSSPGVGATSYLITSSGAAELFSATQNQSRAWNNTGFQIPGDGNLTSSVYWSFGRAPGYMDEVCFQGSYVSNTAIPHNLGVVPELVISKTRGVIDDWNVWAGGILDARSALILNSANAVSNLYFVSGTFATASNIYEGIQTGLNTSTNVVYLFASCPGVSKVGSFTGTGATQVINCGFTGGARFVLIKATSTTGSWYVWDSARGIVAGNDPYLTLNTDNAEVTNTDWVDTAATGFELSNAGGNLANSNGVTYIFLAIA